MAEAFPFDTRDMEPEQANLFMDIYLALKRKYTVEVDFDFAFDFCDNYAFFGNRNYKSGPVFRIDDTLRQIYLCFPSISYSAGTAGYYNYGTAEYQPWGYCKLKQECGHIYIKTETILDEIHNLIVHADVKFEDDPGFSRKYWVAADDDAKARIRLSPALRNLLKQIEMPEPIIEMHGMDCLAGQERTVTKDASLEIVDLLIKIARLPGM